MNSSFQYPSLKFLQNRITELFGSHGLSPAFPGSGCDLIWHSDDVIDVILFGDALQVLLDCDRWPLFRRYRLWVLNQEHRQLIQKVFSVPPQSLGVIPRALLVKTPKRMKKISSLKTKLNFVFSGRPLPEKNLSLICRVVQEFQKKGIDASLHVFGTASAREYEKFLPQDGWVKSPSIHGDQGEFWFDKISMNPVYINMGMELTDDFCVSCAEAEEAGWPIIVPDRGPYREISSPHQIRIPLQFIRAQDASVIAREIIDQWSSTETKKKLTPELMLPETLSAVEVHNLFLKVTPYDELIRRTFIEGMGSHSHNELCSLLGLT